MGWDFGSETTKEALVAYLTRDRLNGSGGSRTLKHSLRGNVLWCVKQTYSMGYCVSETYIACFLLAKQRGGAYGFNGMDEGMHPYYYDCPLSFLDMAPVLSQAWRDKVRAWHNGVNAKRRAAKQRKATAPSMEQLHSDARHTLAILFGL